MAKRGRSINVFLMDGEANGRIKVSIANWNGVAWKMPRRMLDECRALDEFSRSGVYFLFGPNSVYVGQAEVRASGEAIYRRILEHTTDRLKDCWDEAVILTSRDNTLGRTDISFLENYFYDRAVNTRRYQVLNNNTPSPGTVTMEKRSELEEFADSSELIIGVLGYKVFEPITAIPFIPPESPSNDPLPVTPPSVNEIPALPDSSLKIGEYVYTALKNLSNSGYTFSENDIDEMCSPEWSKRVFHTIKPFMKRYVPGVTDNKGTDGRVRFKADPYCFGTTLVYISKEWYEHQRDYFITWYSSLR